MNYDGGRAAGTDRDQQRRREHAGVAGTAAGERHADHSAADRGPHRRGPGPPGCRR
ncbi:hypothetical protein QJS66_04365 [Kocuria rhizophila]|nr:hypothetical protein QJS66_04365 [Kocuria rhizophila]